MLSQYRNLVATIILSSLTVVMPNYPSNFVYFVSIRVRVGDKRLESKHYESSKCAVVGIDGMMG